MAPRAMLRVLTIAAVLLAAIAPVLAEEWRYSDGAGTTITLPEPPRRIIAHSSVAAALIPYGIHPVGIMLDGPPSLERSLDGLDISGIPVVSRGWFDIDAEAVLNLRPDLIVTEYSLTERLYQGGTHEDGMEERLEAIAPIIGIPRTNSIVDMLENYEAFAASLGADVDLPALAAGKAHFAEAVAGLQSAIAAKPGLSVMALSPGSQNISIAVPALFGELNDLTGWGLPLLSPEASPDTSYLTVSWENAGQYQADIILLDDRWAQSSLETIKSHPLGDRLAAVAAGQTGDWPAEWIRSYVDYAGEIEELTALIRRSDATLVD